MADSVWPLLEKRFPAGQYALLAEVSDAAGFSRSRSADGMAMSLWPSRGLGLEGIEIKSFRSDWLRELKMPEKAENIFKYCDQWWLVTTDDTIAKMEEIPATWGWLAVKGKRLITMKEAPKLTPEPLTKHFIAALLKRASKGMIPAASISDKIEEAKQLGEENAKTSQTYELKRLREEVADYEKKVAVFEEASGIKFGRWDSEKKIGEAVRFITNGGLPNILRDLKEIQGRFLGISRTMNDGMKAISPMLEENKIKLYSDLEE